MITKYGKVQIVTPNQITSTDIPVDVVETQNGMLDIWYRNHKLVGFFQQLEGATLQDNYIS